MRRAALHRIGELGLAGALLLSAVILCTAPAFGQNERIISIPEAHNLPVEEAARGISVAVEGVVTDVAGLPYGIALQQDGDGIYVSLPPGAPHMAVGQRLMVHGKTSKGRFAPMVEGSRIEVRGSSPLPAPYLAKAEELASGSLDNRLVEVRGVVRTTASGLIGDGNSMFLVLDTNSGSVSVAIARGIHFDPDTLVDATIRAIGVVSVIFNQRRQSLGASVMVNRPEDITVLRNASSAALGGPSAPIGSIFEWGSRHDWSHRIKVSGILTLQRPGEFLILQDGEDAIRVETLDTAPLPLGARFEAAGFPVVSGFGAALADAVIAQRGNAEPIEPAVRQASKIAPGDDSWLLIRTRGKLVEVHESGAGASLTLEDGGVRFSAEAAGSAARPLARLAPGSDLEVTGINEVLVNKLRRARGFRLLIRTPADVKVIHAGPWLNAGHVLWTMLGALGLALICAMWALMLRARVRKQTAWISESLHREQANARLHSQRSEILGLIGRNAALHQVCEKLLDVVQKPAEGLTAAIGISVAEAGAIHKDWDWIGHAPPGESIGLPCIDASSSSGDLRARLVILCGAADSELLETCRECLSIALEHRDLHERLLRQSLSDPLTQLPNRRCLDEHLDRVIGNASARRSRCALLVMDMDQFKSINDTLGHAAGDIVLQQLARRFGKAVRHNDMVARIGGDEFVAVLENIAGTGEAQEIAARVLTAASEPIDISGIEIRPAVSIGIAMYPSDGETPQVLKDTADARMYQRKLARSAEEPAMDDGVLLRVN